MRVLVDIVVNAAGETAFMDTAHNLSRSEMTSKPGQTEVVKALLQKRAEHFEVWFRSLPGSGFLVTFAVERIAVSHKLACGVELLGQNDTDALGLSRSLHVEVQLILTQA